MPPRTPPPSTTVTLLRAQRELERLMADLAAASPSGASMVGVYDPARIFPQDTVQGVLDSLVSGTGGPTLLWAVGTPWADIESRLVAVGGMAVVMVEADLTLGYRTMTTSPSGMTDLSKVVFIGVSAADPAVLYPAPVAVWFDATFQIAPGGIIRSKNILWQHAAGIGTGATAMGYIDWELWGGGVAPQPGATDPIVRIGAGGESRIVLREGAYLDGSAYVPPDGLILITTPAPAMPAINLTMTNGARLGVNSIQAGGMHVTDNTFNVDSSAILDAGYLSAGSLNITWNYLDNANGVPLTVNPADWGGDPANVYEAINRIAAAVAGVVGPIP